MRGIGKINLKIVSPEIEVLRAECKTDLSVEPGGISLELETVLSSSILPSVSLPLWA